VDGIYCSNHGGRQANGGIPAIDCLPGVVEAAEGLPVLFDSGIRSGADIVKALALGATAVGVGRPYAYGLAIGGEDGVVHVLRSLLAEADLIMAVDCFGASPDSCRQRNRTGHQHDSPVVGVGEGNGPVLAPPWVVQLHRFVSAFAEPGDDVEHLVRGGEIEDEQILVRRCSAGTAVDV
jgi:hypothetical protein